MALFGLLIKIDLNTKKQEQFRHWLILIGGVGPQMAKTKSESAKDSAHST
jgi:hypothetical protein